jgi:hypothetical protein
VHTRGLWQEVYARRQHEAAPRDTLQGQVGVLFILASLSPLIVFVIINTSVPDSRQEDKLLGIKANIQQLQPAQSGSKIHVCHSKEQFAAVSSSSSPSATITTAAASINNGDSVER